MVHGPFLFFSFFFLSFISSSRCCADCSRDKLKWYWCYAFLNCTLFLTNTRQITSPLRCDVQMLHMVWRLWKQYELSKMHLSRDMTKPTKWLCAQRRLRSAWASAQSDQSSLSAWRKLGSLATHWAHSEESDQTGRMPRLIWVFAERTFTLLVLSWGGSFEWN